MGFVSQVVGAALLDLQSPDLRDSDFLRVWSQTFPIRHLPKSHGHRYPVAEDVRDEERVTKICNTREYPRFK
jgi:hypothetical protein